MNIKARELRIGNCINNTSGQPFQVYATCLVTLAQYEADKKIDLGYNPIPLTEEWLLKFGFEKFTTKDVYPTFANNIFNWNNGILYLIGYGFMNHCKYVHQLQNLYFALTGEELISEPK